MKVSEVIAGLKSDSLPPMQRKVLDYLEKHPDEVFYYRDDELAKALGIKPSALGFSFWDLERKDFIPKAKVGRRTYFGCQRAIRELQSRLERKS